MRNRMRLALVAVAVGLMLSGCGLSLNILGHPAEKEFRICLPVCVEFDYFQTRLGVGLFINGSALVPFDDTSTTLLGLFYWDRS